VNLPSSGSTAAGAVPLRRKPVIVSAEADADARAAALELAAVDRQLGETFEADLSTALCGLADVADSAQQVTGSIGRVRVGGFAWAAVYAIESKRVVVAALVRVRPKAKPA
jgi:hypothetical protein